METPHWGRGDPVDGSLWEADRVAMEGMAATLDTWSITNQPSGQNGAQEDKEKERRHLKGG